MIISFGATKWIYTLASWRIAFLFFIKFEVILEDWKAIAQSANNIDQV